MRKWRRHQKRGSWRDDKKEMRREGRRRHGIEKGLELEVKERLNKEKKDG